MANSNNNDVPVTWDTGPSSKSLSTNSRVSSDAMAISADATGAALTVKIDNSGTPTSGDYVELQVKWTTDGTNYDSDEHATYLPRMDTVSANDPGEDPATKTFNLDFRGKQGFILVARANQGATRAITITGTFNEHRSA